MIMIIMRWGTRKKRERQEPLWYRAELAEAYSWVAMHGFHEKAQASQDAVAAFLFLQQAQFRVLV